MINKYKSGSNSITELIQRNLMFTIFIFINLFWGNFLYAEDDLSGGMLDKNVNSDDEDYGAYIVFGQEIDSLFLTSSRPVESRRKIAVSAEMFVSTRASKDRYSKKINEGWSEAKQIIPDKSKIAEFSRGSLAFSSDGKKIIFAGERDLSNEKAKGSSFLFDLYEMYKIGNEFSEPKAIKTINEPDFWDSQPALSGDGNMLYFVSNRDGGKGGLDLWYSFKDISGNWTKPELVPDVNTPGDEYSPHCGSDGYFYFSTNWNYKNNSLGNSGKDIYRADYRSLNGLPVPVNPVLLDDAVKSDADNYGLSLPENLKYNSGNDDEFPYITEDRKAIFVTSNRKTDFDRRNIYAYSLPKSRVRLQVNVQEKILDANGNLIKDATSKKGLNLTLVDNLSGVTKEIQSGEPYEVDADKEFVIQFSKFVEEECYSNRIEGPKNLTIKTVRPFGKDTLFTENVLITRQKVEISPIVFNSTDTLPYFITGYWYPNTPENISEFRSRESSGFFNKTGFVDSSNAANTYNYDDIAVKISKSFSKKIYEPLEELLPAFQDFCRDTLYLKVTIHGYTDPRGLSGGADHAYRQESANQANYPDETITVGTDERGQPVTVQSGLNMWSFNWPIDPNNKEGRWIMLADKGEKGNILLSKLRAYFTFVTFDKAMISRSPIYKQIRDNGKVILDAEGFGIDKKGFTERGLRDDPQSRRIEIYLDILRPEELAGHKRLPGGMLKENQKESSVELTQVQQNTHVTTNQNVSSNNESPVVQQKIISNDNPSVEKFETEEQYADKSEIAEKYENINNDYKTEPLPPSKIDSNDIKNAESESLCYKIYYKAYDNAEDALKAKEVLSAAGIENPRVVEIFDNFGGNRTYELYSGCYLNSLDAINAQKTVSWTVKMLNLSRNPIIMR